MAIKITKEQLDTLESRHGVSLETIELRRRLTEPGIPEPDVLNPVKYYPEIADPNAPSMKSIQEQVKQEYAIASDRGVSLDEARSVATGLDERKKVSESLKHGWSQAGMLMVKGLAGFARIEAEIGGRFREWAWEKLGREKPEYLKDMDAALKEWSSLMEAGVNEYYQLHPEEAIRTPPGFFPTLKAYVTQPEVLIQGLVEAVPLLLEAGLGTMVAGPPGGIIAMGLPITGEVYSQARQEDTEPLPALAQALLTGTGEAAIEQWTFSRKLGLARNFSKLVTRGLPKMLWEGTKAFFRGMAEEGSQEFNRNFWRWVFTDRSQAWFENVKESMAAGGPLELVMAGGFSAAGGTGATVSKQVQRHRIGTLREEVRTSKSLDEKAKAEIGEVLDAIKKDVEADVYPETVEEVAGEAEKGAPVAKEPVEAAEVPPETAEAVTEAEAEVPPVEEAVPTEPADLSKTIATQLKSAKEISPEVSAEQLAERARRVGKAAGTVESLMAKGVEAGEALDKSTAALAGKLTEYAGRFESMRETLGKEVIDSAYNLIATTDKLQYFERINTKQALDTLIDGDYLAPYQAELIQKLFGGELGKVARIRIPPGERFSRLFAEILGIPTTTLTALSGDMSGIMRQARPLGQAYPVEFVEFVAKYAKAWASENADIAIAKETRDTPFYNEAIRDGVLEIPRYGEEVLEPVERGEEFIGARLVERVPLAGQLVTMAERGFVTGIGWFRCAIYSRVRKAAFQMNEKGEMVDTMSVKDRKRLASIINDASGRAHVKRTAAFKRWGGFLRVFFAPQFRLARMRMPFRLPIELGRFVKRLAKGERLNLPEIRMTAGSFAGMIATNLLLMYLVKLAYMAWGGDPDEIEMETDLHSRNGGKVRIKNMRIDLWAGYLQDVQDYAQFVSGKAISQAGEEYDIDRKQLLLRAIRRRSSPLASLIIDTFTGETVIGKRFGAAPKGKEGELLNAMQIPDYLHGASEEVWNRLIPLVLQDAMAAWIIEGVPEALTMGFLSHVGISVATYENWATSEIMKLRNKTAMESYGKKWNKLTKEQQTPFKPLFEELEILKGQEKPLRPRSKFVTKKDEEIRNRMYEAMPKAIREELYDIGMVDVGGIGKRWGEFYLSDERYEKYEELAAPLIRKSLNKLLLSSAYKRAKTPSAKRKLASKAIAKAKREARASLKKLIDQEKI